MKICSNDFTLGDEKNTGTKMLPGACKKAQAYLEGATDGTCETAFDKQEAHSLSKKGEFNHGYVITYTTEKPSKSITIVALCNDEAKAAK
jgi:hypothetical protein